MKVSKVGGKKLDQGKPRLELLPSKALESIAQVLNFGAVKYDPWQWTNGFNWSRLIGAAMRHMNAFNSGEDLDPESGLPHLAHLGCCVLFLLEHYHRVLGTDDRHKWEGKR